MWGLIVTARSIQLSTLSDLCVGPQVVTEVGTEYVLLPKLRFESSGQAQEMDALLCPSQSGGYQTRLFLSAPLSQRGANWTTHYLCGRAWHTWSWNGVPASLTLPQILLAHLGALR